MRSNRENILTNSNINLAIAKGFPSSVEDATSGLLLKWLRDVHKMNVFVGFRLNIKKWDSHVYSMLLDGNDYVKLRPFAAYSTDKLFDVYEDALNHSIEKAFDDL